MEYIIQANSSGSKTISVTERHLEIIRRYSLLDNITDSNGYVDERVLDKVKLNIRSLIANESDAKDLIDLSLDVMYHKYMKAYGLVNLIKKYSQWTSNITSEKEESNE